MQPSFVYISNIWDFPAKHINIVEYL